MLMYVTVIVLAITLVTIISLVAMETLIILVTIMVTIISLVAMETD